MIDDYIHDLEPGVYYTPVNIPGPGYDEQTLDNQFTGCSCSICEPGSCSCIDRFNQNYREDKILSFDKPIFECNSDCQCSINCSNRLVGKGPVPSLKVINTKHKGYGVMSSESIPANSFVCEYAGEIIGKEEAKIRCNNFISSSNNYIFKVREIMKDFEISTYIDPRIFGNIGRYINHSCCPNLKAVPVHIDNLVPHLSFFAIHPISANEELTFDYGNEESELSEKPCYCDTVNCRKFLPKENIF